MIQDLFTALNAYPEFTGLFWFFNLFSLVQLFYLWLIIGKTFFRRSGGRSTDAPPVSVVLTVNNQFQQVRNHLPEILNQSYPLFEVVVVDTGSDEATAELLKRFTELYPHLTLVQMPQSLNWFKGDKFPLSIGIKSARHEVILITDIYYRPTSYQWIREMVKAYYPPVDIVIGHVSWKTRSLFNYWFRFASFHHSLLAFSLADSGIPVDGYSQNLLFSRQLFYRKKGFISHYTISSGVGELFVNRAGNIRNTVPARSPFTRVVYNQPMSLFEWFQQFYKKMQLERYYRLSSRLFIQLYEYSCCLWLVMFAALVHHPIFWPWVIAIFSTRLLSQWIVLAIAQHRLGEKNLFLFAPILEPLYLLVKIVLRISVLSTAKKTWL